MNKKLVAAHSQTFQSRANEALIKWKERTSTLPDAARAPAPYVAQPWRRALPVCLPAEFATLNLLPDARPVALARFAEAGIKWHDGTPAGPSNHLRSSQIQCLNALAPMVDNAKVIQACFGGAVDIAEVLPFDVQSPRADDLIVFEWIGKHDYLNEGHGKPRTRGSRTTSADAAFRYRRSTGSVEIALVEWKYTEQYDGRPLPGGEKALLDRLERYRGWWDGQGPLRTELIPYEDLFVEPFYQLMRLQFLAREMEGAGELDAERVRVVYAAPAKNSDLWTSLTRPSHHRAGDDLGRIWESMGRRLGDFVVFDTGRLVADDAPVSDHFRDRYGHLNGG